MQTGGVSLPALSDFVPFGHGSQDVEKLCGWLNPATQRQHRLHKPPFTSTSSKPYTLCVLFSEAGSHTQRVVLVHRARTSRFRPPEQAEVPDPTSETSSKGQSIPLNGQHVEAACPPASSCNAVEEVPGGHKPQEVAWLRRSTYFPLPSTRPKPW